MQSMTGNPCAKTFPRAATIALAYLLVGSGSAMAEVSPETLKSLSAPDKIETSIGTLEFKDGVPSDATAAKVYDTLAFTRALNAYNNSFRGASALAIKKGIESVGAGRATSSSSRS